MKRTLFLAVPSLLVVCVSTAVLLSANDRDAAQPAANAGASSGKAKNEESPKGKLLPLNRDGSVLLDREGGRVLVKSQVVLREGLLEMLLCKKQTKEHESILAADAQIYVIHAGLVALGAEPGAPVKFHPEFQPPQGPKVEIFVQWTDEKGKLHRVPARRWIRHAVNRYYGEPLERLPDGLEIPEGSELRYDEKHRELSWYGPMTDAQRDKLLALSDDPAYRKAVQSFYKRTRPREMTADWVFAGSGFWTDEETGRRHYQAEGGDVICVANFPSAMLDVAQESSATGDDLLFEAWTERIPPLETEVTVELVPVLEKKKGTGSPSAAGTR